MHSKGWTHTDLKPENILLCDSAADADGEGVKFLRSTALRLIDFGSATHCDAHHTRIVTTRHYRAPEVRRRRSPAARPLLEMGAVPDPATPRPRCLGGARARLERELRPVVARLHLCRAADGSGALPDARKPGASRHHGMRPRAHPAAPRPPLRPLVRAYVHSRARQTLSWPSNPPMSVVWGGSAEFFSSSKQRLRWPEGATSRQSERYVSESCRPLEVCTSWWRWRPLARPPVVCGVFIHPFIVPPRARAGGVCAGPPRRGGPAGPRLQDPGVRRPCGRLIVFWHVV